MGRSRTSSPWGFPFSKLCCLLVVLVSSGKWSDVSVAASRQSSNSHSQSPFIAISPTAAPSAEGSRRVPKQVGTVGGVISNGKDQQPAAGFHHHHHHGHGHDFGHHGHHHMGGHGDSKYFQYAHSPDYGQYEAGHRRGNDYHFIERYEKYGPGWSFKTKVKWGDKKAGYGEHYWDYNHGDDKYGHDGGSDGGGGGGSGGGGGGDGGGFGSEPVPSYQQAQSSNKRASILSKRENHNRMMDARRHNESKRIVGGSIRNGHSNSNVADSQASPSVFSGNEAMSGQIPRPSSLTADDGKAFWLRSQKHPNPQGAPLY